MKITWKAYGAKHSIKLGPDADIHEVMEALRLLTWSVGYAPASWKEACQKEGERYV